MPAIPTKPNHFKRLLLLALLIGCMMAAFWWYLRVPQDVVFETGSTEINGTQVSLEIAKTPQQWQRGLMHRRVMRQHHGMLFIYDRPREISMWMKNTYISLDMVFMDKNKHITRIVKATTPHSETLISSYSPVVYVLELKAGIADDLGLQVGQQLNWVEDNN